MNKVNIKSYIQTFANRLGIYVRTTKSFHPVDTRKYQSRKIQDIIALYRGQSIIINIPIDQCVHFKWMNYAAGINSPSPYIQTLLAYSQGKCSDYSQSPLKAYYEAWQPDNAAELLGIKKPYCAELLNTDPMGTPWFWGPMEPKDILAVRKDIIAKESRENNLSITFSEGDALFGPVSERKGELEFNRLISTYESIKQQGFRIDLTGALNIRGICLESKYHNKTKFMIIQGQHRIAALSVLGYQNIPVQTDPFTGLGGGLITRDSAEHWLPVCNGYLSQDEAIKIFDRTIMAEQPEFFNASFC